MADERLRWTEPGWLGEAEAWIRERASVTGALDQFHVRWWSTVIRVPTQDEDLYFKAVATGFMFEPALTARLFELRPDRVTSLVDVDLDRGWMLMRDAGRRLREVVSSPAELRHWEQALTWASTETRSISSSRASARRCKVSGEGQAIKGPQCRTAA